MTRQDYIHTYIYYIALIYLISIPLWLRSPAYMREKLNVNFPNKSPHNLVRYIDRRKMTGKGKFNIFTSTFTFKFHCSCQECTLPNCTIWTTQWYQFWLYCLDSLVKQYSQCSRQINYHCNAISYKWLKTENNIQRK